MKQTLKRTDYYFYATTAILKCEGLIEDNEMYNLYHFCASNPLEKPTCINLRCCRKKWGYTSDGGDNVIVVWT
jgi:hypothetical protein